MTNRGSRLSGIAIALTAAFGHAAVFAAVALLYAMIVGEHDTWRGAPAIAIGAFVSWLVLAGSRLDVPVWLTLIAGFVTIALSTLLVVLATVMVSMGRFDGWLAFSMAMNVLPFALLGGGTVAAIVSLVYGLALRRFAAKP
ncbi:hypothetical protein [Pseudolabrys sp.]|uniref:hypothetical protein n=1 Tax=Pseudolabrys sp. TaxID=1960880 RepID=UPI003D11B094